MPPAPYRVNEIHSSYQMFCVALSRSAPQPFGSLLYELVSILLQHEMVNVLEVSRVVSSFTASCTDAENGAPLFAYLLPCQRTQSALSNVENGNPYSTLFAIGKNVPDIGFFSLGRGQATSEEFRENKFKTTKPIALTPREDAENANWLSSLHACFGHRFQAVGLKTVVL